MKTGKAVLSFMLVTALGFANEPDHSKNKTVHRTYFQENSKGKLPQHDIYCIPEKKSFCSIESCSAIDAKVFSLISTKKGAQTISRCDTQGCDTYQASILESGIYLNIQTVEPKGLIMKIEYLGKEKRYMEIATQMIDVYMTHGTCFEGKN